MEDQNKKHNLAGQKWRKPSSWVLDEGKHKMELEGQSTIRHTKSSDTREQNLQFMILTASLYLIAANNATSGTIGEIYK